MSQARRKPRKPTPERLANIALHYLSRYAASEASLRRVLENRVRRAVMADPALAADTALQAEAAAAITRIIETHKRTGVLNDTAYAEMKVHSLRRSGRSARRITQQLTQKGVKADVIAKALVPEDEEPAGQELKAAYAFARKRGLGPFRKARPKSGDEEGSEKKKKEKDIFRKEITTFARAGFSFDIAKQILGDYSEDLDLEF